MKLKIEIPKIHCARTTWELGKDEIYCGVIALAGKMNEDDFSMSGQSPIFSALSEVKKKVKKGKTWKPDIENQIFDVDDDTEALAVTIVLYEEDDGGIHDQMKAGFDEIVKPDKFEWKGLIKDAKDILIKDVNENEKTDFEDIISAVSTRPTLTPMIIGGFLFKLGKKVFKFLRQDDFLGSVTHLYDLNSDSLDFSREHRFRKQKGKYDVQLKVTKA